MKNRSITLIIATVFMLLLIPFVAMQYSSEVNWSTFDFVLMGSLLLVTGMLCEFILKRMKSFPKRVIAVGVTFFALFLIWAELAVGIFGTPFAGS